MNISKSLFNTADTSRWQKTLFFEDSKDSNSICSKPELQFLKFCILFHAALQLGEVSWKCLKLFFQLTEQMHMTEYITVLFTTFKEPYLLKKAHWRYNFCCLVMLNICIELHEYISSSFLVTDSTEAYMIEITISMFNSFKFFQYKASVIKIWPWPIKERRLRLSQNFWLEQTVMDLSPLWSMLQLYKQLANWIWRRFIRFFNHYMGMVVIFVMWRN